jgi:hypothetical protein
MLYWIWNHDFLNYSSDGLQKLVQVTYHFKCLMFWNNAKISEILKTLTSNAIDLYSNKHLSNALNFEISTLLKIVHFIDKYQIFM